MFSGQRLVYNRFWSAVACHRFHRLADVITNCEWGRQADPYESGGKPPHSKSDYALGYGLEPILFLGGLYFNCIKYQLTTIVMNFISLLLNF